MTTENRMVEPGEHRLQVAGQFAKEFEERGEARKASVPSVLIHSLESAGLTIHDIPRDGTIQLVHDSERRWWIRVDVLITGEGGRRVSLVNYEVATETKLIPFVGEMEEV